MASPLLFLCLASAHAQDLRRVASPDGKLEFRIFIAPQDDVPFFRLAYQVWSAGKPLIDTSFMGLDIYEQEPILGENLGLIAETSHSTANYNSLLAHYLQNGSTGRSLDVEIRVYNNGVAFRYTIPISGLLVTPDVDADLTQFHAPGIDIAEPVPLPFTFGNIEIAEPHDPKFTPTTLRHFAKDTLVATAAWSGTAPLTGPWRVIALAPHAAEIVSDLPR